VTRVIHDDVQAMVSPGEVDERALVEHHEAVARSVREKIIEGRFFDELGQHEYLRPLFWAVCILRSFILTPLRHFTVGFIDGEYEEKPGGFYLDAIRDMQETTLVQWSSAAGGYMLDPVVRKIMAKNLLMTDRDEFRRRHQEAVRLYDRWIEQYPRNAVGYLIERTFHRYWALQVTEGERQITRALVAEFDRILAQVGEEPDVQWDLPDMAVALSEELVQDEELAELLPADAYKRLVQRAEQFREALRGSSWY
jgi:hypothetical protein